MAYRVLGYVFRPVAPLVLPDFAFCRHNYRFRSVIVIGFVQAERTMETYF